MISMGVLCLEWLHLLRSVQCGYNASLFCSSRSSLNVILINASSSSRSVGRLSDMVVVRRGCPRIAPAAVWQRFDHLSGASDTSPVSPLSAFTIAVMRTSTAVTTAGVTVAVGVLAYAAYFDYKRRNDTTFRKKLRMFPPPSVENFTPDSYVSS